MKEGFNQRTINSERNPIIARPCKESYGKRMLPGKYILYDKDCFLNSAFSNYIFCLCTGTDLDFWHAPVHPVTTIKSKINKKPKRLENSQLIRKILQVNQIFELTLEQGVANYYGDNTIVK